jgi:acyl-CoA synthetase (AMP-forming)/AMP-acid ligase II
VKATATEFGQSLLGQWNWQKDDVLALYTPNSIDTPVIVWGTHYAGGKSKVDSDYLSKDKEAKTKI